MIKKYYLMKAICYSVQEVKHPHLLSTEHASQTHLVGHTSNTKYSYSNNNMEKEPHEINLCIVCSPPPTGSSHMCCIKYGSPTQDPGVEDAALQQVIHTLDVVRNPDVNRQCKACPTAAQHYSSKQ